MTITTEQASLAEALRRDGASAIETAIVLATALEFADSESWLHELRGPDGKWAKTGSTSAWEQRISSSSRVVVSKADVEGIHQRAVAEATSVAREHTVKHVAETTTKLRTETHTKIEEHRTKTRQEIHGLINGVRRANERLQEAQEKDESKKSKVKLAVHIGAILAGAIIAYLEAHFGLGFVHTEDLKTLIEVGSASAPIIAQELADFKKKL